MRALEDLSVHGLVQVGWRWAEEVADGNILHTYAVHNDVVDRANVFKAR